MARQATAKRWAKRVAIALPGLVAALVVGAVLIPGGTLWPWHPGGMMDLAVYQRTGTQVLAGADIYALPVPGGIDHGLPWIYPPFAALGSVPLALIPFDVAAFIWLAGCVWMLMLVLRRLDFHGWGLSLATTLCVLVVEPVRETLGFGQLGIFLVALVVLDSFPGSKPRRCEGWLTGIAAAIKLTPALMAVYQFFSDLRATHSSDFQTVHSSAFQTERSSDSKQAKPAGQSKSHPAVGVGSSLNRKLEASQRAHMLTRQMRAGLVAFISFCVATALGFVLWQPSLRYWIGLISGDSGVNDRIQFSTNQSVMGVWTRIAGVPSWPGMALSVGVIVAGLLVAIRTYRTGHQQLGFCLAALTSLLGSPISWSHHYVWIIPLGAVLLRTGAILSYRSVWFGSRRKRFIKCNHQNQALPRWYRYLGLGYVAWVTIGPFQILPRDNGVEFTYTWWQHAICAAGVLLGLVFLFAAVALPKQVTKID